MACGNFFGLLFITICLVESVKTDYVAAVVEYQHTNSSSPNKTVEFNLNEYITFIEEAKAKSVQIIVFPEYGLTGPVKEPEIYAIEIPGVSENITYSDYWLQMLSNAAVAHSMYVVVNLLEKEKNAKNQTFYYNTNIVFNKEGKIVAKYRKINLFGEPALTPGDPSQNQNIFSTDFGITFGVFTCYDISFHNPARTILWNSSITDIVFPTAWISYLPFFHSLSTQYAYATANHVNLLSANLNSIRNAHGGSSIYGADGTVFSEYIPKESGSKLNIATVRNTPKTLNTTLTGMYGGFDSLDDNKPSLSNFIANRYYESDKYEFKRINISQLYIKEEVCQKSYCCVFNINMSSTALNSSDVFYIMAYYGPVKFSQADNRIFKICALLACENADTSTCGTRNVTVSSKIDSISVATNMPDVPDQFYVSTTLTRELKPVNSVLSSTANGRVRKTILTATNIAEQDVLVFGIIGNKGVTMNFSGVFLVGLLILNYLFH